MSLNNNINNCLFCRIASGQLNTSFIIEQDDLVAFRDIDPKAPHHVLLIPRKHYDSVNQLPAEEAGSLIEAAKKAAEELGISGAGYRLVFNCNDDGGQEVRHVHLHLLGGRKMTWPPG